MSVAGVLLAAGAGRRYGRPKALVRDDQGVPWVVTRALALAGGGCTPVLVVLGAAADDAMPLLPVGVQPVQAPGWAEGMGASLRAALDAVAVLDPVPDAVLVGLVDTPGVGSAVVARLVAEASPAVLVRAAFDGVPAHPVLIGRDHWDGVRTLAVGDRGARDYLAGHPVRTVECGDVGEGRDVDTPEGAGDESTRPTPRHGTTYAGDVTDTDQRSRPEPDSSRVIAPARRVARALVTDQPLDVAEHARLVDDSAAGAVVTFAGVVRDHDHGRVVESIEYVGHPSAGQVVQDAVTDVFARHPVDAIAVSHRLGVLAVGDCALAVAVSAAHRQEAFAAASDLVEEVKHRLPVWKRQVFPDGTDEWVNCP